MVPETPGESQGTAGDTSKARQPQAATPAKVHFLY
jgi:hypothetical protein